MTFQDLQPGDKFIIPAHIEEFRKYRKRVGMGWPWVRIFTKLHLQSPEAMSTFNATTSSGGLSSLKDDQEVILIR